MWLFLSCLQCDPLIYHHDSNLLELLLLNKKTLPLRECSSFLYTCLCSHLKQPTVTLNRLLFARLLKCSESDVPEQLHLGNKAQRVKNVAKELYDGGFIMEAGALLISAQSFHSELSTLNDSLAYVSKVFSKSQ